ncbi:uncharacterized protein Bfra_010932 [Botrytis fragariae]|uniref:Uncharacterized protein n=1 Tax=Botrytis fragariae TaxID=1964551 RepID=A0A8H6EEX0_9HELO|nr:uncharacterized protein Bfra_010932 [Botrytis fragariae]KAF5869732.1 hypothetical protein Bfra_010932 [Botrytis fragariae]
MSGNRRPFKLFSSRKDSNEDPTYPPPYHSTAPTSSQTGGAKPIFDFSNMNISMDTGSSKLSTPSGKYPSKSTSSLLAQDFQNSPVY